VAQVDRPVCIGQGAGDKNFSLSGHEVFYMPVLNQSGA
jgi:hypothetical protein